MPPTIRSTVGISSARRGVREALAITAAAAAPARHDANKPCFISFSFMFRYSQANIVLRGACPSSDSLDVGIAGRGWTPGEQAPLQHFHGRFGADGQNPDDQHGRKHAIGVEGVLGSGDNQTKAVLGAKELADDGA